MGGLGLDKTEDIPGISSVENIPAPAEGEGDPRLFSNIKESGPVEDNDVHWCIGVQMPISPPESEELRINESGPLNAEDIHWVCALEPAFLTMVNYASF